MSKLTDAIEILSDLKWHCTHEFNSDQAAKIMQMIRDAGYVMEEPTPGRYCKNDWCVICGRPTVWRKLVSLDKGKSVKRVTFTPKIRKRVLDLYGNRDAFTGNNGVLEIDHRVTPKRTKGEAPLGNNPSDKELMERYMPLTKVNNNIKREACKRCISTGKRQPSLTGIDFFFDGNNLYEGSCWGCFWSYPEEWVRQLNEKIQ